jgi:arylformamidase
MSINHEYLYQKKSTITDTMNNDYIDITYPISDKLPKWHGSIGFAYQWHMMIPNETNNLSSFTVDSHLGTHLDAPLHFVKNGKAIHELDLKKLIGNVFLVEIRGVKNITAENLQNAGIPKDCEKLLIKTDNQFYWEQGLTNFQEDFCSIDATGAQWIVDKGIHLIGIDYLSIQRFKDGPETHQILLQSEVIIVETLNLEKVNQGDFYLICLPIMLEGLEGAPVRAVLKRI